MARAVAYIPSPVGHQVSLSLLRQTERVRRSEEEEDGRREKRASALRAAERHPVRRAELHRARRGDSGAVRSFRVERQRLGGGCVPARAAAASRLGRPDGESPPALFSLLFQACNRTTQKRAFRFDALFAKQNEHGERLQ